MYSVEIRARNIIGVSECVDACADRNPARRPTVTDLAASSAGNGSVALNWVAPTVDNGSPITDYVVQTAATIDGPYRDV